MSTSLFPPEYVPVLPSWTPVPSVPNPPTAPSSPSSQAPSLNILSLLYHSLILTLHLLLSLGIPRFTYTTSLALLAFLSIGLLASHAQAIHLLYCPKDRLELLSARWRIANFHAALVFLTFLVLLGRKAEEPESGVGAGVFWWIVPGGAAIIKIMNCIFHDLVEREQKSGTGDATSSDDVDLEQQQQQETELGFAHEAEDFGEEALGGESEEAGLLAKETKC